ncbi:MAG TPA: glycosyltransferase, partial [Thermoanaerobaculia bacterium]|nr:glycosyltransferase [Thermoanaerobaculia bacterium]
DPPPPRQVESGIWRLTLGGDPRLDPYRDQLDAGSVEAALASLSALAAEHPLEGLWTIVQLPFWLPLAEAVRGTFGGALHFDCMDDLSAFADHADRTAEEAALARTADLVTVSSERLHARLAPHSRTCAVVRNGCDPEHFGPAAARPAPAGRIVLGFFGGIHEWFDVDLVAALARLRPEWEIWLAGDTYRGEVDALRALPNVRFLGELAYADLPRVASAFDVGILPFKVTPLTEAADPVKVYEMLAAGLPVVAVDLPELRRLAPLVALARTPEEFAARVDEALAEPLSLRETRRQAARRCSWVERFLELRRAMDEVAGGVPRCRPEPTRQALGLHHGGYEAADLHGRLTHLEAVEREGARLRTERCSIAEQLDRVQAEAARLAAEVERIEADRLGLEREVARVTSSRAWRLARKVRSLTPGRPGRARD